MSRQVKKPSENTDKSMPVYRQVACALEDMLSNDYAIGEYLPSENELALRFNVNRHTVRRAIDNLVAAGFVLRQQGKGSLIINNQIEYPIESGRFTASLDMLRRKSTSQVLSSSLVGAAPKIADYLSIDNGEPVSVIETLRFVDNQPMSLITHFLNPQYVPDIHEHYSGGSLHQYIEDQYRLRLKRSNALISAVMPDRQEALYLKSSLTQPLLKIKSFNGVAADITKVVEVSISRSRSDRFQVKIPFSE